MMRPFMSAGFTCGSVSTLSYPFLPSRTIRDSCQTLAHMLPFIMKQTVPNILRSEYPLRSERNCRIRSINSLSLITSQFDSGWENQFLRSEPTGIYSTVWLTVSVTGYTLNRMVEQNLNRVFHALSDPTRRAILNDLASREATVGQISQPFPLSLAAVSKHLGVLERAGLITRETRGRERVCRINPGAIKDARDWLEFHARFWSGRLDALNTLFEPDNGNPE